MIIQRADACNKKAFLALKRSAPRDTLHISVFVGLVPCLLAAYVRVHFQSFISALVVTYIFYCTLLMLFTAIHWVSLFHHSVRYSGPSACKLTNGWLAYIPAMGFMTRSEVHELQKQHGDVVQIGKGRHQASLSSTYCEQVPMNCPALMKILQIRFQELKIYPQVGASCHDILR